MLEILKMFEFLKILVRFCENVEDSSEIVVKMLGMLNMFEFLQTFCENAENVQVCSAI